MKKNRLYLSVAIALTTILVGCNPSTTTVKTPTLNTEIDSLNYAYGLANGADLKMYVLQGEDSTGEKTKQLLAGVQDAMQGEDSKMSTTGTQFGTWLNGQKEAGLLGDTLLTINYDLIRQGVVNGVKGETTQMTVAQANEYLSNTMKARQEVQLEKQYKEKKEENIKFLEDNKDKDGIVTTASGLQYQIVKKGKGATPTAQNVVKVHYTGKLIDGTTFDSSVERGEPIDFPVNQVIPGWTEGLQLMNVGSKYTLYIPYNLAYGAQGNPSIPPFSTLIFDVELLDIVQ